MGFLWQGRWLWLQWMGRWLRVEFRLVGRRLEEHWLEVGLLGEEYLKESRFLMGCMTRLGVGLLLVVDY